MSRVEFTEYQWENRRGALRKVRVKHAPSCGCSSFGVMVFKCRAPGGRFACGRYFSQCDGGDDNRCTKCSNAAWRDLKDRIVAFVSTAKTSRGEVAICQRFGKSNEHAPTEDALHELVRSKRLVWFGDSEKPLRYRLPRRRR